MELLNLEVFSSLEEISIRYWSSSWGTEWEPHIVNVENAISFVSNFGRSSEGIHPFFVFSDRIHSIAIAIPWSGNWSLDIQFDGHLQLIINSDDPNLRSVRAIADSADWELAARKLLKDFRASQPSQSIASMKTEWNHWWPYEGGLITEDIFLHNAKVASECGIEVAVLDAGWFGEGDWEDLRGDWMVVNSKRFPSGLKSLSDRTRALGIEFGIWFEIETIGNKSSLLLEHPDYLATRDGETFKQICLGNPDAYEWALNSLSSVLDLTQATWIKLDYNLSSGLGCNCDNHGHSASHGHYAHIKGLYRLLAHIKYKYPNLIIEGCSSGGLRWDYGIARLVDYGFSSDRDWPEHALTVFWAASHFFPVEKILGWCDSEWLNPQIHQDFKLHNLRDDNYLNYILAISMLGGFGISQKLLDFTNSQKNILMKFLKIYKDDFRPRYQSNPEINFLTDQPGRELLGARTVAFAIKSDSLPPLITIFHLPGCTQNYVEYETEVEESKRYEVLNLVTQERSILQSNHGSLTLHIEPIPNTYALLTITPLP